MSSDRSFKGGTSRLVGNGRNLDKFRAGDKNVRTFELSDLHPMKMGKKSVHIRYCDQAAGFQDNRGSHGPAMQRKEKHPDERGSLLETSAWVPVTHCVFSVLCTKTSWRWT